MNYKVIQSNPIEDQKHFITKMSRTIVVNDPIFGEKQSKETLYIKGTNQLQVGQEIKPTDLFPKFRVEEHEGVIPDGPMAGTPITLKWLHLNTKAAA